MKQNTVVQFVPRTAQTAETLGTNPEIHDESAIPPREG
jgi:hypothetical protein